MDGVKNDESTKPILHPYEKIIANHTFKTTLIGFERQAVLNYIDNLRKDAIQQQRTFTVEIDRLYAKNIELSRSVSNYEKEVTSLSSRLNIEREQTRLKNEENSILNDVVEKMQVRFVELNNELARQRDMAANLDRLLSEARQTAQINAHAAADANMRLQAAANNAVQIGNRTRELNRQISTLNEQAKQREHSFGQRVSRYEETIAYFKTNYERLNSDYLSLRSKSRGYLNLERQNALLAQRVQTLSGQSEQLRQQLSSQTEYVRELINELNDLRNTRPAPQPAAQYQYRRPPVQSPVYRQMPLDPRFRR